MDGTDEGEINRVSEFEDAHTISFVQPPVADEYYDIDDPVRHAFSTSEDECKEGTKLGS